MTERNENSAFVPVPETGTVVPTSGPAARIHELEAALAKAEADARNAALEEAANIAEDIHWMLPMYESAEANEASDDAACAVQEQIAAAIRRLRTVAQSIEQELKP